MASTPAAKPQKKKRRLSDKQLASKINSLQAEQQKRLTKSQASVKTLTQKPKK